MLGVSDEASLPVDAAKAVKVLEEVELLVSAVLSLGWAVSPPSRCSPAVAHGEGVRCACVEPGCEASLPGADVFFEIEVT